MSEYGISMEGQFGAVQPGALEGLISTHFDRTFMVLNTCLDDPRICLQVNEAIYRTVDEAGDISQRAVYGALVTRLRGLASDVETLRELSSDSVLCWLIKETSDLKYADISELMGMDRESVKQAIAEVRWHLLG